MPTYRRIELEETVLEDFDEYYDTNTTSASINRNNKNKVKYGNSTSTNNHRINNNITTSSSSHSSTKHRKDIRFDDNDRSSKKSSSRENEQVMRMKKKHSVDFEQATKSTNSHSSKQRNDSTSHPHHRHSHLQQQQQHHHHLDSKKRQQQSQPRVTNTTIRHETSSSLLVDSSMYTSFHKPSQKGYSLQQGYEMDNIKTMNNLLLRLLRHVDKELVQNIESYQECILGKEGIHTILSQNTTNITKHTDQIISTISSSEKTLVDTIQNIHELVVKHSNHLKSMGLDYSTSSKTMVKDFEEKIKLSNQKVSSIVQSLAMDKDSCQLNVNVGHDTTQNTNTKNHHSVIEELIDILQNTILPQFQQIEQSSKTDKTKLQEAMNIFTNEIQHHDQVLETTTTHHDCMEKIILNYVTTIQDLEQRLLKQAAVFNIARQDQERQNNMFVDSIMVGVKELIQTQMTSFQQKQNETFEKFIQENDLYLKTITEIGSEAQTILNTVKRSREEFTNYHQNTKSKDLVMMTSNQEAIHAFSNIEQMSKHQQETLLPQIQKTIQSQKKLSLQENERRMTIQKVHQQCLELNEFLMDVVQNDTIQSLSTLEESSCNQITYARRNLCPEIQMELSKIMEGRRDYVPGISSISTTLIDQSKNQESNISKLSKSYLNDVTNMMEHLSMKAKSYKLGSVQLFQHEAYHGKKYATNDNSELKSSNKVGSENNSENLISAQPYHHQSSKDEGQIHQSTESVINQSENHIQTETYDHQTSNSEGQSHRGTRTLIQQSEKLIETQSYDNQRSRDNGVLHNNNHTLNDKFDNLAIHNHKPSETESPADETVMNGSFVYNAGVSSSVTQKVSSTNRNSTKSSLRNNETTILHDDDDETVMDGSFVYNVGLSSSSKPKEAHTQGCDIDGKTSLRNNESTILHDDDDNAINENFVYKACASSSAKGTNTYIQGNNKSANPSTRNNFQCQSSDDSSVQSSIDEGRMNLQRESYDSHVLRNHKENFVINNKSKNQVSFFSPTNDKMSHEDHMRFRKRQASHSGKKGTDLQRMKFSDENLNTASVDDASRDTYEDNIIPHHDEPSPSRLLSSSPVYGSQPIVDRPSFLDSPLCSQSPIPYQDEERNISFSPTRSSFKKKIYESVLRHDEYDCNSSYGDESFDKTNSRNVVRKRNSQRNQLNRRGDNTSKAYNLDDSIESADSNNFLNKISTKMKMHLPLHDVSLKEESFFCLDPLQVSRPSRLSKYHHLDQKSNKKLGDKQKSANNTKLAGNETKFGINKSVCKNSSVRKKHCDHIDIPSYSIMHEPFRKFGSRAEARLEVVSSWLNDRDAENDLYEPPVGQSDNVHCRPLKRKAVILSIPKAQVISLALNMFIRNGIRSSTSPTSAMNRKAFQKLNTSNEKRTAPFYGGTLIVTRSKEDLQEWECALREHTSFSVLNHSDMSSSERRRSPTLSKCVVVDIVLTTYDSLKAKEVASLVDANGRAVDKENDPNGWLCSRSTKPIEEGTARESTGGITQESQKCELLSLLHGIIWNRVVFVDILGRLSYLTKSGTSRCQAAIGLKAYSRIIFFTKDVTSSNNSQTIGHEDLYEEKLKESRRQIETLAKVLDISVSRAADNIVGEAMLDIKEVIESEEGCKRGNEIATHHGHDDEYSDSDRDYFTE